MQISNEMTIWCERCSVWHQEASKSKKLFIKLSRNSGWKIRKGKTVCPDCVDELKRGDAWSNIGYR